VLVASSYAIVEATVTTNEVTRNENCLVRLSDGDCEKRLVGFGHVGSGAGIFRGLAAVLSGEVDVWATRMPGRESRILEPPIGSEREIVDTTAAALLELMDRPYALLGSCSGALIAFEVARALQSRTSLLEALIVLSERAPHLHVHQPPEFLNKNEVRALLRKLGGTPAEVLDSPDLMELLLPAIKADIDVYVAYGYRRGPQVIVPIVAMIGEADLEVSEMEARAWEDVCAGDFVFHRVPSGHFLLQDGVHAVAAHIVADLDRHWRKHRVRAPSTRRTHFEWNQPGGDTPRLSGPG
jgi:medium-chain acyl-[acyl-carrier-protein] hydrolase